jgi:sporadic carbohydrate cluster protein (TIGR04323 family)
MTTVISVLTTSKIGIWNMPARGQGFINNHYAKINNYKISSVYQEYLLYNNFYMLQSIIKKNKKKTIIIFCSASQLPTQRITRRNFIKFFKNYEIHLSLELKKGKGVKFLSKIFNELDQFSNKKNINIDNTNTYKGLFNKYKNKIV